MKKIIKKIKSSAIVKNDGKNFLHFFLAFTVIFVALAVIIIQVMQLGMYRATDQNLTQFGSKPSLFDRSGE
ncbi:hypothetical protein LMG8526HA_02112 [Lactococcus lactis]|nr:hypothetical protein [Lactococcus lactis]